MAEASSFITDVPVGCFGLDEALPLISIPDAAFAAWLAGCISPLPGIPVELTWSKRDMAISLLATALCNGDLVGLVRDPVSGELFRLTAADWRGLGLWPDTIVSGMVQASIGDAIERHKGRRVLLEASAFEAWRRQAPELQYHLRAVDLVGGPPEISTPALEQLPQRTEGAAPPRRERAGCDDRMTAIVPQTGTEQMPIAEPIAPTAPPSSTEQRLITEPVAPAKSPSQNESAPKQSRRRSKTYTGPQTARAQVVLGELFPNHVPTEGELPTRDLIKQCISTYFRLVKERKIRFSEKGPPSEEVFLKLVGRRT